MKVNGKGLRPDRLYWSESGHLACGKHAPLKNSDTWIWERWSMVTPEDVAMLESESVPATCEVCGARGRTP